MGHRYWFVIGWVILLFVTTGCPLSAVAEHLACHMQGQLLSATVNTSGEVKVCHCLIVIVAAQC